MKQCCRKAKKDQLKKIEKEIARIKKTIQHRALSNILDTFFETIKETAE